MNSSLDTTIFLATNVTSYVEDDIGFFLFYHNICIDFMRMEKKYVKVIDDYIYNRIRIQNKKWNKKMSRN